MPVQEHLWTIAGMSSRPHAMWGCSLEMILTKAWTYIHTYHTVDICFHYGRQYPNEYARSMRIKKAGNQIIEPSSMPTVISYLLKFYFKFVLSLVLGEYYTYLEAVTILVLVKTSNVDAVNTYRNLDT